ncbi:MAG: hypothetical protein V7K18_03880 [Nostoc sp.]
MQLTRTLIWRDKDGFTKDKLALITGSTSGNASHPLGNQGA